MKGSTVWFLCIFVDLVWILLYGASYYESHHFRSWVWLLAHARQAEVWLLAHALAPAPAHYDLGRNTGLGGYWVHLIITF